MRRRLPLLALTVALAGCGGSPSPSPSPPADGSTTIRGTEQIGWDQAASGTAELGTFRYAIYVDGTRSEVAGATCGSTATGSGFACTGRLPSMSPGVHTLELAAFVVSEGNIVESPRSAPLRVTVDPSLTAGATAESLRFEGPAAAEPSGQTAADSASGPAPTVLAEGFQDITDLALAGSQLLFVAERHGLLHLLDLEEKARAAALVVDGTEAAGDVGALSSVAADPNFEATGHVYVLQTVEDRDGPAWQVARYRVGAGGFGERAVIVRLGRAAATTPGTIRIGADGTLYLALPGEYVRRTGSGGFILRVNQDGSTPRDDWDAEAPLWATTMNAPAGLAWHPVRGWLWTAQSDSGERWRLSAIPAERRRARERGTAHDVLLPDVRDVHRLAPAAESPRSSPRGGVLLAAESGLYLARPSTDTGDAFLILTLVDGTMRAVAAHGTTVFAARAHEIVTLRLH